MRALESVLEVPGDIGGRLSELAYQGYHLVAQARNAWGCAESGLHGFQACRCCPRCWTNIGNPMLLNELESMARERHVPLAGSLECAIAIAALAHAGQVDKAQAPYILHPIRVMLRMTSPEERIVAVLHDVVEDTMVKIDDLREAAFSDEILAAVEALTKRPGEDRVAAARRAAANELARRVKLADNAENSDLSRIANPTQKDYERLEEYRLVRSILEAAG